LSHLYKKVAHNYIVKTLFKSCESVIMTVVSHMLKGTSKLKLYHYSFTLMSLQTLMSAFSQSPKFTLLYFHYHYHCHCLTTNERKSKIGKKKKKKFENIMKVIHIPNTFQIFIFHFCVNYSFNRPTAGVFLDLSNK